MKKLILITLAIMALTLVGTMAWAQETEEVPTCEQCGMFFHKSPTQVKAVIGVGTMKFSHIFESMVCYINFVQTNYSGKAKSLSLEILDYNSFGTDKPGMLAADKAFFLYGTAPLKGSMGPFIATFSTKDAAKAAEADLGGEVVGYEDMMKKLAADVAAGTGGGCACCSGGAKEGEGEPAKGDVYACSMGCVDSDKPGECPECGMEMKKK